MKIAFKEAYFREEIDRDPTLGAGEVKYEKEEVGIFTAKELHALCETCPGVFDETFAYTAFLLAASVAMRRSEILALTWEQIDFESHSLNINRAVTDNGLPKWDKLRTAPIPVKTVAALLELRSLSEYVLPRQYVICYMDGRPRGNGWWQKAFSRAMVNAGFINEKTESVVKNGRKVHLPQSAESSPTFFSSHT